MKAAQGVRLLLVDDEPHILQFLELGLINEGFEVRTAPDGVSAIAVAAEFKPHGLQRLHFDDFVAANVDALQQRNIGIHSTPSFLNPIKGSI